MSDEERYRCTASFAELLIGVGICDVRRVNTEVSYRGKYVWTVPGWFGPVWDITLSKMPEGKHDVERCRRMLVPYVLHQSALAAAFRLGGKVAVLETALELGVLR